MLKFDNTEYSYGMDFGTFRSMMAVYDPKTQEAKVPTFLSNNSLNGGIPSLFWYSEEENETYIGDQVTMRSGELRDPEGICKSIKMKLGQEHITIHDRDFSSSEIARREIAYIVEKYSNAIEETYSFKPSIHHLVVGVPVCFNAGSKGRLKRIIEQAFDSSLSCSSIFLVPEPVLAAIAYKKQCSDIHDKNILVFDMGAGTFDVAYLENNENRSVVNPYPYVIKKQMGSQIAGDKIDEALTNYIIDKCEKENPDFDRKQYSDKTSYVYLQLRRSIQKAKEDLSFVDSLKIDLYTFDAQDKSTLYRTSITRDEFEKNILESLIKENIEMARDVLEYSGAVNFEIVLVGGSCYIPFIKRKLVEVLGERFNLSGQNIYLRLPEIAVALGAAQYSADPMLLSMKTIYGYGYKVFKGGTNQEIISIVIPAEAELPITTQKQYSTRFQNQTAISLSIYEVVNATMNSDIPFERNNGDIKTFNHNGIQGYTLNYSFGKAVSKDTPVLVTTTLTENGILRVNIDDYGVSDCGTITNTSYGGQGRVHEIELELSNLMDEGV